MKVSELLDVLDNHCCGIRVQNDALIDEGNEVLADFDIVDNLIYSDVFDDFIDEEVTDLYAETTGKIVICIYKDGSEDE